MYFCKIIGPRPICLMLIKFSAYSVHQSSIFFSFSSVISFKMRINTEESVLVGGSVLYILVILFCHVLLLLLLPVELQYLNNRNTKKHEIWHVYIHTLLLACAQCRYIFVNQFTSYVTDCYQLQQYIIMETETVKICMYKDFMRMRRMFLYFRLTLLLLVTDRYLPQQYIIMQTIKCLAY